MAAAEATATAAAEATATAAAIATAMDVVSDSDSDSDSEAGGLSPSDWTEVEQDLYRLCALHTEASQRMEALRMVLALEEEGWIPTIQSCHEASLEELERTGNVTFGARLLAALQKA